MSMLQNPILRGFNPDPNIVRVNNDYYIATRGVPDSCGVWAPQLSYNNGRFYLVYTNVKSFDGPWKDTPNYFVSTTDITGN